MDHRVMQDMNGRFYSNDAHLFNAASASSNTGMTESSRGRLEGCRLAGSRIRGRHQDPGPFP